MKKIRAIAIDQASRKLIASAKNTAPTKKQTNAKTHCSNGVIVRLGVYPSKTVEDSPNAVIRFHAGQR